MTLAIAMATAVICIACAVADVRTGLIPNAITYFTLPALLVVSVIVGTAPSSASGAVLIAGSLAILYKVTGSRGLGLGDVKLGACIGAGLGPFFGVVALGLAFLLGGTVGMILLLLKRARRGDRLPFGPFLAAGTVLSVCFAPWTPAP